MRTAAYALFLALLASLTLAEAGSGDWAAAVFFLVLALFAWMSFRRFARRRYGR